MRLIGTILIAVALAAALVLLGDHWGLRALGWASDVQLAVQTRMAGVIRAIKAGEPWALLTLCALTGAYGFVHALGPGHGKVLLGGAALGTRASPARIFAIGAAASLAQALAAILLVLVVVNLFRLTSTEASALAEGALATLSRIAIAAIGAVLVWRGLRAMRREQHHHHHCGCGHAHGPTPEEVTNLSSAREVATLVLSVAARPCTGAVFLLVIAWRFGIPGAGILGVLAMGLGTAVLNALAIGGGLAGRRLAWLGAAKTAPARIAAILQLGAGAAIVGLSLLTLA